MTTTHTMPAVAKREQYGLDVRVTFVNGYSVVVPPKHPLATGIEATPKTAADYEAIIRKHQR